MKEDISYYESLTKNDLVRLEGTVDNFKNNTNIIIDSIEKLEKKDIPSEVFKDKFIIVSKEVNVELLKKQLNSAINSINDEDLKLLTKEILLGEEYGEEFMTKPGAKSVHHDYYNGLLEHTLNVTKICMNIYNNYDKENIDKDILLTGCLLHDIGKIKEYDFDEETNEIYKTKDGELIGHIPIGYGIVNKYVDKLNIKYNNKIRKVYHILLSHHGKLEYGSPVEPKISESHLVHLSDMIDSKMEIIDKNVNEIKNNPLKNGQYNKYLYNYFFWDNE